MNVSYRQLKAFVTTARLCNFTKAAEELHLTQSGLSFMMRQLEAQLDCRLFERTTRLVALTPGGEHFLPVAQNIVESMDTAHEQLAQLTLEARNKLVIGVTPLVSTNVVPAARKAFVHKYPDAKLNFVATNHDQIQALVAAGEIDFGLGAHFDETSGVDIQPLFQYNLMWITPGRAQDSAAPDLGAGVAPWSALRDAPLFALPSDNHIQKVIERHLSDIRRPDKEQPTFNNLEMLIAMVSAGEGTAILPSYSIAACRRHGVQTAILTEPRVAMDFYRITRRGRAPAELMDAFTEAFVASIPT